MLRVPMQEGLMDAPVLGDSSSISFTASLRWYQRGIALGSDYRLNLPGPALEHGEIAGRALDEKVSLGLRVKRVSAV